MIAFDRENKARMDMWSGMAKVSFARMHSREIGHVHEIGRAHV